ncbi:PepSY domain-containing protein [Mycolicibacterium flavescens]|uniref:Peptidase n=1 Tax=Mycolicibacterium flavescens TaxID=1776 RepID=A0A1E3RJS0_MYCFV|nr:PepSY-associated TM helix domain-containing protein [Mycolicibacterium flavescens]MCV7282474.1 PepSY domain-containing protein [Mycolicibacterium flavescens]ODQ90111.1 peptidase [Mycolicibacterium flavescens]
MTTTPEKTPQRQRPRGMRPLLARLHFYAGVFVGPFILIAAVTGLLYAVIPQIDNAVHRHELKVDQVGEQRLPLADQLHAARAAHPEGAVVTIRPPAAADETTQVRLAVDDVPPDYARTVFVDPYTGEVRGALTTYGQWMPVRAWFDELHRNLHLGALGRNYSELAASWLWVIALAGTVLWCLHRRDTKKLRRLALPDRSADGRRRTLSWHGAVGVWIVVALLGLSVTGITWSRYGGETVNLLQERLNTTAPAVDTALPSASAAGALAGADVAYRGAIDAGLAGPMWMSPPAASGEGWLVEENKRDWPTRYDAVSVDPDTGVITDRVDFADWPLLAKLTNWAIDAHMGVLFGWPNQILLALTAIGLITVIVRGYVMWWRRRPTRGSAWATGRPPLRGALRTLHPAAIAVLAVFVVALGWALPLFGLSLVAFLAVDLVVGAVKQRRTTSEETKTDA